MDDRIAIEMTDGVADVRMIRADKLNALDDRMFLALIAAAEQLRQTRGLRAIVLSGAGKAFCAGLDMARFAALRDQGEVLAGARDLRARTHGPANFAQCAAYAWRQSPVPVIAAVHGAAFGGGFQIALGADIRLVAPDARFSIMEIKWGIIPDMAGMALMKNLAREDIIRELTYTGRIFSADEALAYGFATKICAVPLQEALKMARAIADKNPHAIRAAKRLLDVAPGANVETILQAESDEQFALLGSPNQIEAVMAQMAKRAPRFEDV